MCTLIKAGELTEADLPRSFCGDDSLSSSDGEYGSAMANRPPRVYISPARLCDSRTLHVRPHPRNRFPPLSPIRHRSILVQSHVPVYYRHGILPAPFPWSLTNFEFACERELESRTSITNDERPPLGFLSIDVFHRCLPLKTFENSPL